MAGAPAATSVNSSAEAKGLSSGAYTTWQGDGAGVGATQTAVQAATVQQCLIACDVMSACAGVVMEANVTIMASTPLTSCKLITGDSSVSLKRSVTKVVLTRLMSPTSGKFVLPQHDC